MRLERRINRITGGVWCFVPRRPVLAKTNAFCTWHPLAGRRQITDGKQQLELLNCCRVSDASGLMAATRTAFAWDVFESRVTPTAREVLLDAGF
jgi:hypothetical protein